MDTLVVLGLGNPGKEYEATRHNAGFLAVDAYASRHAFPLFKPEKFAQALLADNVLSAARVILAKPQTFMNQSGKTAKALRGRFPDASFLVLHDDLDLPFGSFRYSENRGSAGHKGVESVMQALGTKDFARLRIGILPEYGKPENSEKFVLDRFSQEESDRLPGLLSEVADALDSRVGL